MEEALVDLWRNVFDDPVNHVYTALPHGYESIHTLVEPVATMLMKIVKPKATTKNDYYLFRDSVWRKGSKSTDLDQWHIVTAIMQVSGKDVLIQFDNRQDLQNYDKISNLVSVKLFTRDEYEPMGLAYMNKKKKTRIFGMCSLGNTTLCNLYDCFLII